MNNPTIVLAYSGGLDTSYCIKYLDSICGLNVHAVYVNTGGLSDQEAIELEEKAYALGAVQFQLIESRNDFYNKCLKYLIYGNILRNHNYPLSVSAERSFQALKVLEYAKQIGTTKIAHGSTAAGNDQVRFDLAFHILDHQVEIITPIRDQSLSRAQEVQFLQENGIDWSWDKAQYSVNKGLWGTTVGGSETLSSDQALPEYAFPDTISAQKAQYLQVGFRRGEIQSVNGQSFEHHWQAIEAVEGFAAPFGIGRDYHTGDTVIGIKGRVGFQATAPKLIIEAHRLLEKHTLGKWQAYWKDQLANWYGMMLHEGQYLDPVMRDIEAFLGNAQGQVNGTVTLKLFPYRFETIGIESEKDLMQAKFGTYGEENLGWTGTEVRGFTKIMSNAQKIFYSVNPEKIPL